MLHDPSSQLMDMLITSLKAGKICVIDVSQLRGSPGADPLRVIAAKGVRP